VFVTQHLARFVVTVLSLLVCLVEAFGQQAGQAPSADQGGPNPITSLASQLFEHNFFNVYAFANGVYDSEPLTVNGQSVNDSGWGFDGGGGANAVRHLRHGYLSLSYRGEYRDYQSTFFPSGTSQSLSFAYENELSRRWTFSFNTNGGIFLYGGTYFAPEPTEVNNVQTNPFSSESKFLESGISLAYRQTGRLSYVFNGEYYLNRYNLRGAIGSTGVTGSGSLLYRTTARTTLGATFSHTYFTYQRGTGEANADTLAATISHMFREHWFASASAGVSRTTATGSIEVPVLILNGNNVIPGFALGHYNTTSTLPAVQGTLSRQLRRSAISVSGGQGVSSGNGVFLASKNRFLNGYYSYNQGRRANLSFGGGYSRLTSISNNVSFSYHSASFSASYAYNVMRHIGTNIRYDYVHYGGIGAFNSRSDNRISFGVYFTSKAVPLTLF
jgi:hypothetical protein